MACAPALLHPLVEQMIHQPCSLHIQQESKVRGDDEEYEEEYEDEEYEEDEEYFLGR